MKSALELAMEKSDKMGGGAHKLTEAQRQAVAQIRQVGEAKKAEIKIMMDDKLRKMIQAGTPKEEIEKTHREFLDQIDRIDRETESKAEKAKKG